MSNPHPSFLSFTGSISPSIFVMGALYPDNKTKPIEVFLTTIRSTISGHSNEDIEQQLARNEKAPNNPNIQRIEIAQLPIDSGTLQIKGSVNFFANSLSPNVCNEEEFIEAHNLFIEAYKKNGGYEFLGQRYFMNMINGAILWRNRYGRNVETKIEIEGKSHLFRAVDISPHYNLSITAIRNKRSKEQAKKIISKIAAALKGNLGKYTCLQVNIAAQSTLGSGQNVYPSHEFAQKMIRDTYGRRVSKILAKVRLEDGIDQAVIHSQKIGNAIRTIDDWYEDNAAFPIAVEPYGADLSTWRVLRKKNHFYKYLIDLQQLAKDIDKKGKISPDAHFVAACFVRGGVFSKAKNKI